MIKRPYANCPHVITHVEYFSILVMMVLKTSDYWVQLVGGSQFLPGEWVHISQIIDHSYQTWISFLGFVCALIGALVFKARWSVLWNVAAGLLWVLMILTPFPFERMTLSLLLCIMGSTRIIGKALQQFPSSKPTIVQHKCESPNDASQNKNVFSNKNKVVNNAVPCDLDLSVLDIGTRGSNDGTPQSHKRRIVTSSPGFVKPIARPLISPARFSPSMISSSSPSNLTKASWVAGGYWQQNSSNGWESPSSPVFSSPPSPSGTHTTLTRSSSQSSGFGSTAHLNGFHNRSPPDSRPESTLEEIDRLSVFSENLVEHNGSSLRYVAENSLVPYTFARNNVSPTSMMSSLSSLSGATPSSSPAPVSTPPSPTSSWLLPFLFGFSLAVNLCVVTYVVFLHSTKT